MGEGEDMWKRLDEDTARNVACYLDAPADIIRLSAVSSYCRRIGSKAMWLSAHRDSFVRGEHILIFLSRRHFAQSSFGTSNLKPQNNHLLESRCSKDLCIRISPEVSRFNCVVDVDVMLDSEGGTSTKVLEWDNLEREHRAYTQLALELMSSPADESCISAPINASSTDNYPEESIIYTLDPRPREDDTPFYWSSKGESNIGMPETLTYRLSTNLCIIHEVKVRPFEAYFQRGSPIYSANAVRFRFGNSNSSLGVNTNQEFMASSSSINEEYVWTYVSPEFPMQQEDKLQTFKLPRPVLCIGNILQVELLGRVQKQEMDGLYYICISHVHVVGRPLLLFDFTILGQPKQYILKYSEKSKYNELSSEAISRVTSQDNQIATSLGWHSFAARVRQTRAGRVLTLLGIAVATYNIPNDQGFDEDTDADLII